MALPPARSISVTTDAAASAPFVYVMATLAPSAARRLAMAAPMPREPPVTSAIFPSSFLDIVVLLTPLGAREGDNTYVRTCRRSFRVRRFKPNERQVRYLTRYRELESLDCAPPRLDSRVD